MPTQEEIKHQQTLLNTYRRSLAHYLKQQATLGEAFAPPAVAHGITEAREHIFRIKQILRSWNIPVEDHVDDDGSAPGALPVEAPRPTAANIDRVKLKQILVDYFNDEELRDLAFELTIDYESLPGAGKSGKARELVAFAERHGRFAEVVELVQRLRPGVL
jgi:hypothetical protein